MQVCLDCKFSYSQGTLGISTDSFEDPTKRAWSLNTLPVRSIGRSELYRNLSAVVAYGLLCTCDGYLEGTDFLHALEAAGSLADGQLAG